MYKNLKMIVFSLLCLVCLISLAGCGTNWDAYKVQVVGQTDPVTVNVRTDNNGFTVYQGDAETIYVYCVNENSTVHSYACVKLVQYENFFKVYTEDKVTSFSNSLYGYYLESNV